MDFDSFYAALQGGGVTDQDKSEAKRQAIMAASLGLLASAPSAGKGWGGLARGIGQGGLLGMNTYYGAMDAAGKAKKQNIGEMSQAMQLYQQKQGMERQGKMDALAQSSIVPGFSPFQSEGRDGEMFQQPGRAPQFDPQRYATGLAAIDPMKAFEFQQKLKQESPLDKPKPEHYTPASLAAYSRSGNFADLVPVGAKVDSPFGKVNPSDFTPNSVAKFQQTQNYQDLVPIDKRPISTVSVRNYAETEEDKAIGKARGEAFTNMNVAAHNAGKRLADLSAMESLLGDTKTNALTPIGMTIAGRAKAFGIDLDPKLSRKEAADAIANKFALDSRGTAEGGGMPGAMSDKDREFLRAMNPNLSQTTEGRKLLIEVQRRTARRTQELAKMAREYRQKNGKFDEVFQEIAEQYAAQNPLFADLMQQSAPQQQPGGRSAGGMIGAPSTPGAPAVYRFDANGRPIQ